MSDEELMRIAFADKRTVQEILRYIFELGEQKGRADAIDKLEKLREFYRKEQDYDVAYGIGIAIEQLKEKK